MTPSRRLRGPRDYSDASFDSPTKSKTVTFQAVPDVKEFEPAIGESATPDASFEQETQSEGEEDGEWADEDARDNSLEDILHEPETLEKAFGRQYRVANPDVASRETSEDGHGGVGDESATAEFMDTLISEGLFSPPELSTPAFEDYSQFHLSGDEPAPFLSTPSMGDSVHATPLLAGVEPQMPETDAAGIPYGRTHHAERNAAAHSAAPALGAPISQPAIPHGGSHQMLLNANAAQPALATGRSSTDQMAHQSGTMPDPFLTIQTATNVITPQSERQEGGIPLGRTSHIERMQAARMLATQSLGIGMPRSPGLSQTFSVPAPVQPSFTPSADEESVDSEMLFDASFEMEMSDEEAESPAPTRLAPLQKTVEKEEREEVANGRRLPKPPKVESVRVPSPVTGPSRSSDVSPEEKVNVGQQCQLQLALTSSPINMTSPRASVFLQSD
jgi:serine/arginine repetitive matrix protein 2